MEKTRPAGVRGTTRALSLLALTLLMPVPPSVAGSAEAPPTTVPRVDLQRYAGRWHEIARMPNWFQRDCVRDVTADYRPRDDGRVEVVNRCLSASGEVDEATGVARVVDPDSRAKLAVSFVSLFGFNLFWGDYWILDLDADYRYAVVGHPDREYGWILARQPRLDQATLAGIFDRLRGQGYDPRDFVMSDPAAQP